MTNNKSQKMKILFIASGNHGAPSPVVQNQGDALVAEGLTVDYFLIKGKGIKGYLKNVKPLQKYLKEHKYDAIHAHYSLSAFVASLAGAKPLVVSLMGSDVKAAGWYKFIIRLFAAFGGWKSIIVKSNDMYRSLGIKRAIIIPNGVSMERFLPMSKSDCQKRLGWDASKKHILFPANASRPEKDFALAKEAVALLQSDFRLKIEDLRFDGVELHAFENTPNEETPYWYNAADVVLMTSKWEGSPNAIKEAMACSRPIVATNVGDIAERTKGVEGCYVAQSRNPHELASHLEKTLTFTVTKGRERIIQDQMDRHVINQKLIDVYK